MARSKKRKGAASAIKTNISRSRIQRVSKPATKRGGDDNKRLAGAAGQIGR